MSLEIWQPAYESYLKKALAATWQAEEQLSRIGHNARKEALVDQIRGDLRSISEGLMDVWKSHYGADSWPR